MHIEVYVGWALTDAKKVATVLNGIRTNVVQAEEYCDTVQPLLDFSIHALTELKQLLTDNPFVPTHIESAMYRYVDSIRVKINQMRHDLGAP